MTNVDFESILIIVIDKCRFWRCADADFGCRMAGHEDYLDAGGADQYWSHKSIREKVQLVQVHDPDTLSPSGGERMFDSGKAG